MTESQNLLAEYVQTGSDVAFHELVTRYVDLVHSTALRLVEGDTYRAEDVAQTVFVDLVREAQTLPNDIMLGGWLHRHTCFVAANTMRGERRRQSRERQAIEMNVLQNIPESDLSPIAPILDEAINELREADRTAILLRFFEQHDFRSIGQALGSTEDAARMKVSRALDKLRGLLQRRGFTTSAATLSLVLSADAAQTAPIGLAATISAAAGLAGKTLATTATATVTKGIAMTTIQKAFITATIAAAIGVGIHEARQAARLRAQLQSREQQKTAFSEKLQQSEQERGAAMRQIAALGDENERLSRNTAELLRLRGGLALLRADSQELARLKASAKQQADSPDELTAELWLSRADTFRKWIEGHPEQQIPEFQYLRHASWLDVVKDNNLAGDNAPLHAAYMLRQRAKEEFANEISNALRKFIANNTGNLPTDLSQLNSYLSRPLTEDLLKSYKLLYSGKIADAPKGEWLIIETRPQEDPGHTHFAIGTNGWATIR